ncbi:MAG: hypothetical protein COU90_02835 [Candidatus Ryanbacteria bacterium CG10_big_fil_rev_8_21_14_0_10_43_42]|uniref:Sodium/calcium exchanger membrane region domain-containing protein n=1 Tax=Candidatus Ryanbacteria bacterium CG10_big_fil_rev_8_21_14_0_10_43_42 TaxID=1974864 RepID=A0A2M8KWV2_9BACT|nr:MAG: hypothetical protein COU90_02835 [Candidatus Ryanbacteria bacterium CG10_big_fil_rev_8_21_14_0_10_43_42]
MAVFYLFIFILSSVVLAVAGNWLVRSLSRIAHYFKWQEFIAAFFIMSFAVSVPELFIGVSAALTGIPELSFGNIIGANIIHFTLAISLAALVLGKLEFEKENMRVSVDFTIIFALFPFLLMLDNNLSRGDGVILIASFFIYSIWVFSKKERFSEFYMSRKRKDAVHYGYTGSPIKQFRQFINDGGMFIVGIVLLLASAQGIVSSASFFAGMFHLPLVVVGVFIVGLGTALPETYFAVASARRGNGWMVVGNLLGSTVFTASFVLGVVALIHPIVITNFSPYIIARIFLIMSAIAFLHFSRTGRVITSREALFLLMLYVLFVITQLVVG